MNNETEKTDETLDTVDCQQVGAVMVVGGGISGMQSAIDLVNSGFKVYLVEETSAIGGRMAQLDKTFPTNDCSMCLISPKLIEVAKNHNIELMTNSEVRSVDGTEGNFKVKVLKKPRYIIESKCSACGDCISACPVNLADEFNQCLSTCKATYKRYPQAVPNAMAITKAARPPCKLTCPAECNGQGYIALISQGKYVEAVDHIKQWLPLPSALGRICHHPCEFQCNRNDVDEPVGIRPLKRFVADIVRQKRAEGAIPPEPKLSIDPSKPKIAVIGSGPSGLACALDLARHGYPVTIFEASAEPGGQLRYGIPAYRLPRNVLAAEIKEVIDAGIELKCNMPIGEKLTLADLKAQGYRAIYLAVGTQKSRRLNLEGADLLGVRLALDFLREVAGGRNVDVGKKVVVVGGGNVALDVARTARRLGATSVSAVCLESRQEIPAHTWEIEEAEEEDIRILNSWGPHKIIGNDGKVTAIEFKKCTSVYDAEKKFNPTYDESNVTRIECDTVIMAIGQEVDFSFLPAGSGVKKGRGSTIAADPLTLATGEPGIFAGGDGVTGPKSAVEAIHQGHEAAVSIERFLNGADLAAGRQKPREEPAPTPAGEHDKTPRLQTLKIPLERRLSSFDEVEIGYTEEEARKETSRCLNCGMCSECLQCVAACKANAIDHFQLPEEVEINVGSIILAPGIEIIDPHLKEEYGYGRMPNVVTSMEFERILSASGPTGGVVKRQTDGRHPVRIAWIQCVGSRDESCGKGYCSSMCCMQATKQAIIAREHDANIQPTIFYNDLRAYGKGFERYYVSAKEKSGVKYIKSIPSSVKELQQTHNLLLDYIGEDGVKVETEFDLVVLSVGIQPSAGSRALADHAGVEVDEYGFCRTGEFSPNVTTRPGVFVAGSFENAMDIPESVMNGSSAACLASEAIAAARRTLLTEKMYPPEIDVNGEEPRVGVFVCRCGANIARVVDVPGIVEYARGLPNVVHAEENLYTCSTDTQNKIINMIKEKGLTRVVVASCTPRTHESLFQDTIREAGLNKYLFEMANIRDQCSWVHFSSNGLASEKARDLVRMAVARSVTLQPLHSSEMALTHRALIIGGGLSGMTAALSLAAQGYESVLVEREKELGGNLRHVRHTEQGGNVPGLLDSLQNRITGESKITVYKGAEVKKISGYQGNFETEIITVENNSEVVKHGVVIVATGGIEYRPTEYLYGQTDKVITQLELEDKISRQEHLGIESMVMIQCVGSREPEHNYCSRVCCHQAIKNAIRLKTDNPDMEIAVLYRDVRTYGKHEKYYRKAREMGVTFIRYDAARKPQVELNDGKLMVKVFDTMLNSEIVLEPDIVTLSTGIRPQPDAQEFASRLKLPLTQDGFFMEAHMKLRPLDFASEGMYLCGLAHSPKSITESIVQARGAVSRALTVLSQPHLMAGAVVSVVNPERCVGCLTCVRSCPYGVPAVNGEGTAYIEPAACQGCGICTSACPRKAIKLQHYEDAQVLAKTAALIE